MNLHFTHHTAGESSFHLPNWYSRWYCQILPKSYPIFFNPIILYSEFPFPLWWIIGPTLHNRPIPAVQWHVSVYGSVKHVQSALLCITSYDITLSTVIWGITAHLQHCGQASVSSDSYVRHPKYNSFDFGQGWSLRWVFTPHCPGNITGGCNLVGKLNSQKNKGNFTQYGSAMWL